MFAADELAEARERLASVVATLEAAPKVALLLEAAEEEPLAFLALSREHWPKLRSTNPLERLNKEIARRSEVVCICRNDASRIRRAGGVVARTERFCSSLDGTVSDDGDSPDERHGDDQPIPLHDGPSHRWARLSYPPSPGQTVVSGRGARLRVASPVVASTRPLRSRSMARSC